MATKKKSKLEKLIDLFKVDPRPVNYKRILRSSVRGHYDIQEVRMSTAQRLCTNILVKLGVDPGKKIDDSDPLIKKLMKMLLEEYKLITEAMVEHHHTLKKALQESDGVISDATEFALIRAYVNLKYEEAHLKSKVEGYLDTHFDLWNDFIKHFAGFGPLMGGVIISEFDIHKAHYVTSLWKYAGLDVVEVTDKKGNKRMEGRGRKESHQRKIPYIDKHGDPKVKMGLSHNPFLKSKLMGVLAPGILMQHARKPNAFGECYYYYRHRIEQRLNLLKMRFMREEGLSDEDAAKKASKEYPKKRIDLMSKRYMIKMFLKDLYVFWRQQEGLPVHLSYEEAKLGLAHRGGDVEDDLKSIAA